MPRGKIKTLVTDRGFGFIGSEGGGDLFFYQTALQGADYGVDFNSLRVGQEVEFEIGKGRDGRPQAINVRLLKPQSR